MGGRMFKKRITLLIVYIFVLQSAGLGYALRPLSKALSDRVSVRSTLFRDPLLAPSDSSQRPKKILLVNIVDKDKIPPSYPLGLYTLKTYMENNYPSRCEIEVKDVQLESLEDIAGFVAGWNPDILGVSVMQEAANILDRFTTCLTDIIPKQAHKPLLVMGRNTPTIGYSKLLNEYPRAVCVRGEGELALGGLLEYLEGKRELSDVHNIAYNGNAGSLEETERNLLASFDKIGIIDYSDIVKYISKAGNFYMETGRGCPWERCTFCPVSQFWGVRMRRDKPNAIIIEELKQLQALGIKRITFTTEDFFGNGTEGIKKAKDLAQAIIDNGITISLYADIRADSIYNKRDTDQKRDLRIKTLKLLKRAGLETVFMGLETGSPTQLKRYKKGSDVETAEGAIAVCRELGLNMAIGFIMIDPLVSKQEILESVDFIRRNKILPNLSSPLNRLRVYPFAGYRDVIRKEEQALGRKLASDEFDIHSLAFTTLDYKYPEVKVISNLIDSYARSEYDFYNSIKWFVRFFPAINTDEYTYLKEMLEKSKEYQIDLTAELAALEDIELIDTQRPYDIFRAAITKRNRLIKKVKEMILAKGHARECKTILLQIEKYLESSDTAFLPGTSMPYLQGTFSAISAAA